MSCVIIPVKKYVISPLKIKRALDQVRKPMSYTNHRGKRGSFSAHPEQRFCVTKNGHNNDTEKECLSRTSAQSSGTGIGILDLQVRKYKSGHTNIIIMNRTFNQTPLEKRIKPILDRIHLVKDLLNRAEYERVCTSSDPDCGAEDNKELPELIETPVDPKCLRDNLVPIIFLIGGPGSGKGAQATFIVRKYRLTHISLGELIREEIENETPLGLFVAPIVAAGDLISTNTVLMLLKKAMLDRFLTTRGFLIDGFPRTQEQAVLFEKQVARAHLVIYLEVEDATMKSRLLSRGRSDDQRSTVLNRISVFHEYSAPLKYEFGKRCKVVLGELGPRSVWLRVDAFIAKMLWQWAFTNNDLTGDGVEGFFHAPYPKIIKGQIKPRCEFNMSEVLGGGIPYLLRMDCTRRRLTFPGQDCAEDDPKVCEAKPKVFTS